MNFFNAITRNHPDLFVYLPSDIVHPHDRFMEKTVLRLIPSRVTPNQVTAFRLAAVPFVVFLIAYEYAYIGMIAFLLVAFTDVMDGSLARTRNQITRFGMLFDPFADKMLIGSLVLLLAFEHLKPALAFAVLGMELAFIVFALVAKYKFKTIRMANIWGKIKMILQVLAVFFILLGLLFPHPLLFTIAAWLFGIALGFAALSLFSYGI